MTDLEYLNNALAKWVDMNMEAAAADIGRLREGGISEAELEPMESGQRKLIAAQADEARPMLARFLEDNSTLSADQLESLAESLSPGGVHTGGLLVRLIRAAYVETCPTLTAAVMRYNWHGGKVGFQFLPDPRTSDLMDYEAEAEELIGCFADAARGDARRLLNGTDRRFFESLPDRFAVYRGCAGVSPEMASAGICWTVRREVAEWFATRLGGAPVLMKALVSKADVVLAKSNECEVVLKPAHARTLKCRSHGAGWRPEFEWSTAAAPT